MALRWDKLGEDRHFHEGGLNSSPSLVPPLCWYPQHPLGHVLPRTPAELSRVPSNSEDCRSSSTHATAAQKWWKPLGLDQALDHDVTAGSAMDHSQAVGPTGPMGWVGSVTSKQNADHNHLKQKGAGQILTFSAERQPQQSGGTRPSRVVMCPLRTEPSWQVGCPAKSTWIVSSHRRGALCTCKIRSYRTRCFSVVPRSWASTKST